MQKSTMSELKKYSKTITWLQKSQVEHGFIDFDIRSVFVWQFIKETIFQHILIQNDIVLKRESKSLSFKQLVSMRVQKFLKTPFGFVFTLASKDSLSKAGLLLYPFIRFTSGRHLISIPQADILVSQFSRKINDRYSLTDEIESEQDCITLTKAKFFRFFKKNILVGDVTKSASRINIAPLNNTEADEVKGMAEKIEQVYGFPAKEIERIIARELIKFLQTENYLMNLIKQSKIKRIYMCWNKLYFPLVSAARKLDVRTIEFQHGTIHAYHTHYSYPGVESMPYLPDEIRFFGTAWPDQSFLPKSVKRTIYGAPHLNKLLLDNDHVQKESNLVLVVSQTVIGVSLFQFTAELSKLRRDLKFIYKLHPSERYSDLEHYLDDKDIGDISVVGGGGDTYELMARASYQLGVSSTTLIEGMVFQNRIVVVPLPSFELMESEIKRGHASLAMTPKEAARLLSNETPLCTDTSMYFSNSNLQSN